MKKITIIGLLLGIITFSIAQEVSVSYEYDALNRLKKAVYSNGTEVTYIYDALGNRLTYTVTGSPSPLADIQWESVSMPTINLIKGENYIATCELANTGNASADNFVVKAYLSASPSATDIEVGTLHINSLGSEVTQSIDMPIHIPATASEGNQYIVFVADVGNVVSETHENNNTTFISVNIMNALVADFTVNTQTILEGNSVQFTDASTNSPTSWFWSFQGGSPATSNAQNPLVTYNQEGIYDVSLTVSNASGSTSSITQIGYIVVEKKKILAGQIKYWNEDETYMPSPFSTEVGAPYPQDYFYVTLLHVNGSVNDSIKTIKVDQGLNENQENLSSYFQFDIDTEQYGSDAEFILRVWDGGLAHYEDLQPLPEQQLLKSAYTYRYFGGVNATDALAVQLMTAAVNIHNAPYSYQWVGLNTDTPPYGYYAHAIADVNCSNPYANGGITALDALTIKYRSVGLIDNYPDNGSFNEFSPNYKVSGRLVSELPIKTFPIPFDWDNPEDIMFLHSGEDYKDSIPAAAHYYESEPIIWSSNDNTYINIYYAIAGDVNSSYTPEDNIRKRESDIELAYNHAITAQVGETVTLPIHINNTEKLGAITLGMTYRNDLIEVLSTNYNKANGEYHIDQENGLLNIAWYDNYGKTFTEKEAVAYITVKVLQTIPENTELFSLTNATEFADVNASKLAGVKLSTYHLNNNVMVENKDFSSTNYPNPFKHYTTIAYTLPESGKVDIAVYDLTGRLVKHLLSENQTAGAHQIQYNAPNNLNSGLLIYKITLNGNNGIKTITKKMSVSQLTIGK